MYYSINFLCHFWSANAAPSDNTVSINPLPASDNNPDSAAVKSLNDHITLDRESYEKGNTEIPPELLLAGAAGIGVGATALAATRKSDTPIPIVASTAAEVADSAAVIDADAEEPSEILISLSPTTPNPPPSPCPTNPSPSVGAPLTRHATLETPHQSEHPEIHVHDPLTISIDESTSHRSEDSELITEPAPQPSSSPVAVHGEIVPEAFAPHSTPKDQPPTVVVSDEDPAEQDVRTVEVVEPTPATGDATQQGENQIFSHDVWNQSVSPLLQLSMETGSDGNLRQRKNADVNNVGSQGEISRPGTSGSDVVSQRRQRNLMATFWSVFMFSWLGGVGRFFTGIFGKKKGKKPAANGSN